MSGDLVKSFLDDIVAHIDDDTPRLVYADWLGENGHEERAEFIRVQVERARLPEWDAAQVRLRRREAQLLEAHGEAWLAEMPAIRGVKWEGFRRGIVAEVAFASYEGMRAKAAAVRAAAPVEAAAVRWPRRGEAGERPIAELRELTLRGRPAMDWTDSIIEDLARSPQLATVRVLTLPHLSGEMLSALTASPHLGSLRALRLPSNILGNSGVRALTRAATLTGLEELDLSTPDANDLYHGDPILHAAGLERLANWPGLAGVRTLKLGGSDVRRAGLAVLLGSPHATALKSLSLRAARLDGEAMAEFRAAAGGPRLEALDVGENVLEGRGVEHLAAAPCLRELKSLHLDRCEVPLAGARHLAEAAFLPALRRLEAGYNRFGPAGLDALLRRRPAALHTLGLRDNDLFDQGAALLAGSPASCGLLEVDLSRNSLTSAAALALSESAHLRGLLVLRVGDNPIDEAAAARLAASPLGRRLAALEIADAPGP